MVADRQHGFVITGNGDLLEPDDPILAIGSGGGYALAAARALLAHSALDGPAGRRAQPRDLAADICIYTNRNLTIVELE